MPYVTLDHTLADLYSQDGDSSHLIAVFVYPTRRTQGMIKKFTYQTPLAPSTNEDAVSRRRLHNIPLKMGFLAGNMPLVFLELDQDRKGEEQLSHHIDAFEIFSQLHPDQRPDLSFVPCPEDIQVPANKKIVVLSPVDRIAHLPHVADPEIHYDLLSKKGLAYSGLPTPETSVIDSVLRLHELSSTRKLEDEVERMMHPVLRRELPFIVKAPQAVGGLGTFILHTEAQRQAAAVVLRTEIHQMLQSVTSLNQHLHPCCLVLQEFVPGETMGLTMFVTQRGRPIFNGCCTQALDAKGLWSGGTMSYPKQPELEKRFAELMEKTADFLHGKGYYGPAGMDIMVDPEGRPLIIDLNVRVTGSYSLGCLRSHFFEQRGLSEAILYSFNAHCLISDFQRHFQEEVDSGVFVLITWTSGLPDGSSLALVCMASTDLDQLRFLVSRVESFVLARKDGHNCHDKDMHPRQIS